MAAVNEAFDSEVDFEKADSDNSSSSSSDNSRVEHHEEHEAPKGNEYMQKFAYYRDLPFKKMGEHSNITKAICIIIFALLYNAYFIGVIWRYQMYDLAWEWCDELGFLFVITVATYAGIFYYQVIKRFFGKWLNEHLIVPWSKLLDKVYSYWFAELVTIVLAVGGMVTFVIIDAGDDTYRLVSLAGGFGIIFLGFFFSAHPGYVQWRTVVWGVVLEFIMGLLVLRWPTGRDIFQCLGDKVTLFLGYADAGAGFVYGYLASQQPFAPYAINVTDDANRTEEYQSIATAFNTPDSEGNFPVNYIFIFKNLSVIYFFSFCVSMLYYANVLQWVVNKVGWLLYITMGTTAAESLSAAGNIFLGQTEAPLLVKPFLPKMTKSELHAIMTGGFATVAGTVLAAYIGFGIDAAQLISASVMAAPAALAFSKLWWPETEKSQLFLEDLEVDAKNTASNILDAAAQGASVAIDLVMNIAASLVAFLAFIEFLNEIVAWLGELAGVEGLSFEYILGLCFIPIAYMIGVPSEDVEEVARLIGIKTIINEFAAFQQLGELAESCAISKRAETIATFALCGFANPSSIGIQLGGLGAMAPERRDDLSRVVMRAFIAGCVASLLNACVAGSLLPTEEETAVCVA